ncbi:MAG: ATP synthase F1 subunit delta, partial [Acidimicrobiia bacterium]
EKEHEWRQALTDIAIPDEKKERLLADVLGDKVSPHTLNVLNFVVRQGRSRELVEIADELARLAEEEAKRVIAEVRSAVDLNANQIKRLEKALGEATGKNVTVKVVVDPSVVGGLVARVGDVVIDGSIRHKLDLLKSRLGTQ